MHLIAKDKSGGMKNEAEGSVKKKTNEKCEARDHWNGRDKA